MAGDATIPRLTVEDWTLLQARLAWCYEGEVPARFRRQHSRHRRLLAWCLLAGSATIRRGKRQWRAEAGDWLLAGPEAFEQEFSDDARILSVNFRLEWPSGESLVAQPLVISAADHPELLPAGRALVKFIQREFPEAHVDLWLQASGLEEFFGLQQLFSRWVLAYLRAVLAEGVTPVRMRGMEPRVAEALRRLDRHAWTEPFREQALAAELGISAGHLERVFSRSMGLTLRAYLQKRRVEAALAALADRTVPVKKAAYDLGFASVSHFSHWVKKATGSSPRAYRKAQTEAPG